MHVYWCSVFILPKVVICEVEKKCGNFLWHGAKGSSRGGLVAWEVACQQKELGGLGVKPVKIWNQIAQIRHIWELIEEKQTLWAIWVTSTKLKQLSFLGITKTIDSSWNWRNLLKLRKIVKPMVKYHLRDGKKIFFLVWSLVQWLFYCKYLPRNQFQSTLCD